MIVSMTGFSSKTLVVPLAAKTSEKACPGTAPVATRLSITMTLKSLNARFFEATCKLPYALTHLETELIKRFKAKLFRGNVYFTLHMTNPQALTSFIEPALCTIDGYLRAIKTIDTTFGITGTLTINDLIKLPHVFETQEHPLDPSIQTTLFAAIDELIDNLTHERSKEGLVLAQDLHQRIHTIRGYLQELEPRALAVMQQRKETLFQTLRSAVCSPEQQLLPEPSHNALYAQLERIDIHEEIVRFKMHIDSLFNVIEAEGAEKGKKLDFILQELFREINTMAAKCSDAQISGLAINIKVELEKAREQTQNIV